MLGLERAEGSQGGHAPPVTELSILRSKKPAKMTGGSASTIGSGPLVRHFLPEGSIAPNFSFRHPANRFSQRLPWPPRAGQHWPVGGAQRLDVSSVCGAGRGSATPCGPAARSGSTEGSSLAHHWLSPHYFSSLWALLMLTPSTLLPPPSQGRVDALTGGRCDHRASSERSYVPCF